jgi:signal peptidase I
MCGQSRVDNIRKDHDDMEQNSANVLSAPSVPEQKVKQNSLLFSIFDYAEVLVFCLLIILAIYACGIRICSVSGDSMLPTLEDTQNLLVSNVNYQPKNGDIVVFHQINDQDPRYNEPIIKRVIATEKQHVVIDFAQGTVSVDGKVLKEDYIQLIGDKYYVRGEHHMVNGIMDVIVPEGCLFVMGDNRNESLDSRSSTIGFVDERRLLGRVIIRLTPTELFGKVR